MPIVQTQIKKKKIKPVGPRNSKIIILTDSPGKDDEITGYPLTGSSGTLFTQLLNQTGISRNDCYITSVIKFYYPNHSYDRLREQNTSVFESIEELRKELATLSPNVIIPLGELALEATTGLEGITKWRGSIIHSLPIIGDVKVIPTIHPSTVQKMYRNSALVLFDLSKALKESKFNDFSSIPIRDYKINPTFQESLDLLQRFKLAPALALDIETDRGANFIKCVGFADSANFAGCIPFVEKGRAVWAYSEECILWEMIRDILTDKNIKKIIQNMDFEMEVLFPFIGEIYPVYMDTMIASHLYLPEIRKALAVQTSIYTNEPYYKDDAKEADYEPTSLYTYNCKDCAVTYEIYQYLEERLKEIGLHNFLHGFQMPLGRLLWRASHKGIRVDTKRVEEYRTETEGLLRIAEDELFKEIGEKVNTNSPKQICHLLYDKLGYPAQFKLGARKKDGSKNKSKTVDDDSLTKLNKLYPSRIFPLILEIRKLKKLLSTYLKQFWDDDGRCRASFRITGAETGRLSSTENIRKTGLQLQNIPGKIRDIFIADEGCELLKVDLSQVESRLVAYLSQDPTMMRAFENGDDIHSTVGSMIYGKPYEQCGKGTFERKRGKQGGHSSNYRITPFALANSMEISKRDATIFLDKYYNMFNLNKWHQEIIDELRKSRTLFTPHGRRRIFYDRWPTWKEESIKGGDLFKTAYANVPQGAACDHINLGAVRIWHRLPDCVDILIQCHDELVLNYPVSLRNQVRKIVEEELAHPIYIHGREVIIPVDISTGQNWKMEEA
jgi:DNA polymerase I